MKKWLLLLSLLVSSHVAYAYREDTGFDKGPLNASDVSVKTTSFSNNLTSADNTVQKALNTLDQMSGGGTGPGGADNTLQYRINSTTFGGALGSKVDSLGNVTFGNIVGVGDILDVTDGAFAYMSSDSGGKSIAVFPEVGQSDPPYTVKSFDGDAYNNEWWVTADGETHGSSFTGTSTSKFNSFAGNVGISTTVPRAKLDIIDAGGAPAIYVSTSNSSARGNIFSVNKDGDGNVGINSAAPGAQLDVSGPIRVTAQNPIQFGSDSPNRLAITSSANTAGNLQLRTGSSNATRMTVTDGGNVGIGSATPGVALDVQGDIRGSNLTDTKLLFSNKGKITPVTNSVVTDPLNVSPGSIAAPALAVGTTSPILYGPGIYNFFSKGNIKVNDRSNNTLIDTDTGGTAFTITHPTLPVNISSATNSLNLGGVYISTNTSFGDPTVSNYIDFGGGSGTLLQSSGGDLTLSSSGAVATQNNILDSAGAAVFQSLQVNGMASAGSNILNDGSDNATIQSLYVPGTSLFINNTEIRTLADSAGSNGTPDYVATADGVGNWYWTPAPTLSPVGGTGSIQYVFSPGVQSGNTGFIYTGSNVGINSTAPSQGLDVGANMHVLGNVAVGTFAVNNTLNVKGSCSFGNNAGQVNVPANQCYFANNVGIGTTNPPNQFCSGTGSSVGCIDSLGGFRQVGTQGHRFLGNVGIGTTSNTATAVIGGNAFLDRTTSALIFREPDGTCGSCTLSNAEVFSCASITCP